MQNVYIYIFVHFSYCCNYNMADFFVSSFSNIGCVFRSIYLSGGVTMLPGLQDRLTLELKKLAPPGVPVEVFFHPVYLLRYFSTRCTC